MLGEKFTLDIRPTFVDEFDEVVAYIELKLHNPAAADKLVADVYAAIDETLEHPAITQPVYREPDVAQPYYVIRVRNYSVFYIVRGDVMEVRWFRYAPSAAGLSQNPAFQSGSPFDEQ